MSLRREIAENKPAWVWRGTMFLLFAVLSFVGAWLFNEVSAAPKVYSTKEEVRQVEQDNDDSHQEIRQEIRDGFKETQRMIMDLQKDR